MVRLGHAHVGGDDVQELHDDEQKEGNELQEAVEVLGRVGHPLAHAEEVVLGTERRLGSVDFGPKIAKDCRKMKKNG